MMDSKWYDQQYGIFKDKVKDYERDIQELERIRDCLQNGFDGEANDVNQKMDGLRQDLVQSVRQDACFGRIADACDDYREASVASDNKLNGALTNLNEEIRYLERLKSSAETQRDQNATQRDTARERERQEYLDRLNGGLLSF